MLLPERSMHVQRAVFLFVFSMILVLIPDGFTRAVAIVGFGYSLFYLVLFLRAQVVLSSSGLTYRGAGIEKTLPWDQLRAARTTGAVHQGGMPLIGRFGVTVERIDSRNILLPGFDSKQSEAMEEVVRRIEHWRASGAGSL